MIFQVVLTEDASKDLEELYDYIASHDAPSKASYVLDQIRGENVYVMIIADGRRDMRRLLKRRLAEV